MEREADFLEFAHWHTASGDIDPVYPVLARIGPKLTDTDDELLSLILLYVAYYDLGSALWTWEDGWRPGKPLTDTQLRRPTGTERRGHRTLARFSEHISALGMIHKRYGSWEKALWPAEEASPQRRWLTVEERLRSVRGNGRWAAYKTGEMLKTVAGWDLQPTDAGHDWSTGPRQGLTDLFPELAGHDGHDPQTVRILDGYTQQLVEATGHPVEQVETHLCDWHSTLRGHYYVGHDIDLMLAHLGHSPKHVQELVLAARADSFDAMWLGEVNGWPGIRKELNRLHKDEGTLAWW